MGTDARADEMEVAGKIEWADEALRKVSNEERRIVTSGYFPTSMEILGVSVPLLRGVVRELQAQVKGWGAQGVLELCEGLVHGGTHEGRQVGYELLERRKDARGLLKVRKIRNLGRGNDNWASVDAFSVMVAGPVWREGRIPNGEVLKWTLSKDPWWRRTALVATVALNLPSRGGTGDPERTYLICDALASDGEPMVAKGLSWALRSLVGVDRVGVSAFLEEKEEVLSSLVLREVGNKLSTGKKSPKGGPGGRES
jgi:3-methyladenine DNA glycosylase AlkD